MVRGPPGVLQGVPGGPQLNVLKPFQQMYHLFIRWILKHRRSSLQQRLLIFLTVFLITQIFSSGGPWNLLKDRWWSPDHWLETTALEQLS